MVVIEIIQSLVAGMGVGFYAILKMLPIYEQLNGVKEQLISAVTGIPAVIISIALFIPTAATIIKKASSK